MAAAEHALVAPLTEALGRARRGVGVRRSIIPGFGLSLGVTIVWLSLIVLLPLSALAFRTAGMGWSGFLEAGLNARAIAAYRVSFGAAAAAASINAVFGTLVAWVLVRYNFPGRRLVGAIVDLPFALPTAVAGIALTSLFAANGWIGGLLEPLGVKVAFTWLGITVALTFVGLPFVVRSIEPVLADLGHDVEEAATTLGASRFQTFNRVIFPAIMPALLTGFAMAFARGVGEYGSVIFIAGNMPYRTEIAPLLIVTQLEQYDYAGATAIAVILLLASFSILVLLNLFQAWNARRVGGE
ncbi:sulfate ABC transporter permease subunit CysT [Sphingomonas sp.]|uniref:sulfate ABC transporter permease subunit CysT n=1 Tax=Sphingomonas sp. TaxID=28214 RepID=UPI00286A0373|nr:sulfate ABC transporter permease subunit CysT [Sphingomonas sp.]